MLPSDRCDLRRAIYVTCCTTQEVAGKPQGSQPVHQGPPGERGGRGFAAGGGRSHLRVPGAGWRGQARAGGRAGHALDLAGRLQVWPRRA